MVELDHERLKQTKYEIVARSDLQLQMVDLLKTATVDDDELQSVRDEMVAFVESDRYVELARENARHKA